MSEELKFTVTPLFTEGEKSMCICCPNEHVFSYTYSSDVDMQIYDFVTNEVRKGDKYKQKKFKITIELLEG